MDSWKEISFIMLTGLLSFQFLSGSCSATFTITNKCPYTVWPGILSSAGPSPLSTTGFALQSGESTAVAVPADWSGRLWGRTLCSEDSAGKFSCATADCGSSTLECLGGKATPPVTLAEFRLNGTGGADLYEVSLVDGFNLPMMVKPRGGTTGTGSCKATGCVMDLNVACPTELKVMRDREGVACNSWCKTQVLPCLSSEFFKSACPNDRASFTCVSADYSITFCPTSSKRRLKAGNEKSPGTVGNNMLAVVAASVALFCGVMACRITILLSRRGWSIGVVAGTRAHTIDPNNPQPEPVVA